MFVRGVLRVKHSGHGDFPRPRSKINIVTPNKQGTKKSENVEEEVISSKCKDVAFPERQLPIYKRRASPDAAHFKNLHLLVSQLDSTVDSGAYAAVLKRCNCPKALDAGKAVHAHIIRRHRKIDLYLGNLLIQMYGNCKSLEDATSVFQTMSSKDAFTWTMLIYAHAINDTSQGAFHVYHRMLHEGLRPYETTFSTLISVCANSGAVEEGKLVHSHVSEANYDEGSCNVVMNSLIKMYGKFRMPDEASKLFERTCEPDVSSYSSMATAYAKAGHPREAVRIFERMWKGGYEPSVVSFERIIQVCTELGVAKTLGKEVLNMINEVGFSSLHILKLKLFEMYARCGETESAKKIYDSFRVHNKFLKETMAVAYARNGEHKMAAKLLDDPQKPLDSLRRRPEVKRTTKEHVRVPKTRANDPAPGGFEFLQRMLESGQ